ELEQEYVHGQFEFQGYYYVGYGKWLFEQNRYYDTFSILERAFNYLKSQIDDSDTRQVKAFYDICNIIGVCLSNMDREDEACFYFRQGAPGLALTEANKLALCHAKLGNPIAMKQMTDWLMLVAQKYGDHQNWSEEVKQFSADVPVELSRYKKKVDEERAVYRDMLLRRGKAFEAAAKECGLEMVPFDAGFFASIPMPNPDEVAQELEKENIFLVPLAKGIRVSVASVSEEKCRLVPARIKAVMERLAK
ncbi:MAG: hypothetical protein II018_04365, partial [Firmicutes bacterium]|nr:hypothetical protein [Bacillota bacterium]